MTITGKIEDVTAANETVRISFQSLSTPQFSVTPAIIANSTIVIPTNPNDGTFSVNLYAGNYLVTINTTPNPTTFNIAIPDSSSTADISTVVSSSVLPLPGVPTNQLWNGIWAGEIYFNPIANPSPPTSAPEHQTNGHQTNIDIFVYQVVWINANGFVTAGSGDSAPSSGGSAGGTPNNATRVTLPTAPSGATQTAIYRSTDDSTENRYLLAQVASNVGFYDDWESTADFNARLNPAQTVPIYNTTAGLIYGSISGNPVIYITDQGFRALKDSQFDTDVNIYGALTVTGTAGFFNQVYLNSTFDMGRSASDVTHGFWRFKVTGNFLYIGFEGTGPTFNSVFRVGQDGTLQLFNATTTMWNPITNTGGLGAESIGLDTAQS